MKQFSQLAWTTALATLLATGSITLAQGQDDAPRNRGNNRQAQNDDAPQQQRGQRGERGQRGQRGEGERPGRNFDPEQMRQRREQMQQRRLQMIQQQLNVTDEEWQIIGPRIEAVQNLRVRNMPMMMGGRRGGPGMDADAEADQPANSSAQRLRQLRELVRDENAQQDDIRQALNQLRQARQREQAELKAAQDELRELLTLQQEATLVTMGMLD